MTDTERIAQLETRMGNIEHSIDEVKKDQKDSDIKWDNRILCLERELATRLPMWATILITLLGGALGYTIK